jgi:O-antigen/teichoic acid export membrane protein
VLVGANSVIARLYARNRFDELRQYVEDVRFWTIWPSLALSIGLGLAASPVLQLFGPEFLKGRTALYVLLVGQMFVIYMGPAYELLIMTGHQTAAMRTFLLTMCLATALNFLLIPVGGIEGAAVATAASMLFRAAALAMLARHHVGVRTTAFIPRRSGSHTDITPFP